MARRVLIIGAVVVVVMVTVALAGLLVISNTNYGRERVRRIAQSAIQGAAKHGVVKLGRVSGNLLEGFTIADVSIRDSAGAPFLVADTVSLNYGLRGLLLKRAGSRLTAGRAAPWKRPFFEHLGLIRLRGTIQYPGVAHATI